MLPVHIQARHQEYSAEQNQPVTNKDQVTQIGRQKGQCSRAFKQKK